METFTPFLATLLSVLLLSAFVKIFTTLSILRLGLGLDGASFGVVFAALAFVLAMVVVEPQMAPVGGLSGILSGTSKSTSELEKSFRPFMEKHTEAASINRIQRIQSSLKAAGSAEAASNEESKKETISFAGLTAAFLTSQISQAFYLGLLFIIPFLVLDLLVTNVLMVLGITQISQRAISLPLKLLLFYVVDGWALLTEKILGAYL
jgi:flagellar biosynthesis protein FliP